MGVGYNSGLERYLDSRSSPVPSASMSAYL